MNTENIHDEELLEDEEEAFSVVDCDGKPLASGDTVQTIRDLDVKGTKISIRKGTVIKNIKMTGDEELVECRVDNMKGIMLRTEFLRKRAE
jgi:protein PhnA